MTCTIRNLTLLLLFAASMLLGGTHCAKKSKRTVTLEGPEHKYEVEVESTDKDPED